MGYFSYYTGEKDLPENAFKISPSRLANFLDNTTAWYRECLLGEEGFTGNTASVLGTVVHGCAEAYVKEGKICSDEAIEEYLATITDPEIDLDFVRIQYPGMVQMLISEFVSKQAYDSAEDFIKHKVKDNIFVAGSTDGLAGNYVIDYKTTSGSIPNRVPRNYYFQQMAYVWIYRNLGIPVEGFKLVYVTTNDVNRISEKTGKRLKDYPSKVEVLTHIPTGEDMDIIENTIKLVADSVSLWNTNPELRYILAQDYRLKQTKISDIFKQKEK